MGNYAVDDWNSRKGSLTDALDALETQLELVTNTKTIYVIDIIEVRGAFEAVLVVQT